MNMSLINAAKLHKQMYIFWHVYVNPKCLTRCCTIIRRQFSILKDSGLLNECQGVAISYISTIPFPVQEVLDCPKIQIVHTATEGYEGITSTILHKWAKNNVNLEAAILYIHTRGTRWESDSPSWAWTKAMEFFVIKNYKKCINLLSSKFTVGCELFAHNEPRQIKTSKGYEYVFRKGGWWHYSGNMWWARASYIRTLPIPDKNLYCEACEDWLLLPVGRSVKIHDIGIIHQTGVKGKKPPYNSYYHAYTPEYYEHGGDSPCKPWKG